MQRWIAGHERAAEWPLVRKFDQFCSQWIFKDVISPVNCRVTLVIFAGKARKVKCPVEDGFIHGYDENVRTERQRLKTNRSSRRKEAHHFSSEDQSLLTSAATYA